MPSESSRMRCPPSPRAGTNVDAAGGRGAAIGGDGGGEDGDEDGGCGGGSNGGSGRKDDGGEDRGEGEQGAGDVLACPFCSRLKCLTVRMASVTPAAMKITNRNSKMYSHALLPLLRTEDDAAAGGRMTVSMDRKYTTKLVRE